MRSSAPREGKAITMAPDVRSSDDGWAARERGQASAYDHIGEHYDEAFPHKDIQVKSTRALIDRLPRGARVLDVGCGTGVPTAQSLTEAGLSVTGVDISPVMLDIARRNVPEAEFAQVDLVDLSPEQWGTYDAVVAYFALLHLPRAHVPHALSILRSMLEPDGWFMLSMVEADVDDLPIPFLGHHVRVTGYFRDDLRGLLTEAGFTINEEETASYAPSSAQADPEIQLFFTCRRTH
ncbi:methyltransferase family protein [Nocardiopsis sp. Huas11]|uniref:class I SAM-dependent DNA methyltransferase n=1 Tax=Nocardiopsis sp. Huas11 TaxID=2183912 RepID=UPI000F11EC7E|nr:class I SAM-dependent methyltransferase [Nocardiopsis sp. Huas11]RKS09142.1 methyltransferase family protein [Nocardiopsis sp. Huas11]